jgi:2',3'-cyclic-nucleotide 3'-phosphodiesterase
MPSSTETQFLRSFMQEHPQPGEGTSSFPAFDPHVTLASVQSSSNIVAILRKAIPTDQHAITARLDAVVASDTYFRSVIVKVEAKPELVALRDHVADYLLKEANIEAKSPMFPHLSIHYIDEPDAHLREIIVKELYDYKRVVEWDQGIQLVSSPNMDSSNISHLSQITIQEIWIVECEGPVEGWEVLDKMILNCS